jgi:hypothetical protein
MGGERKFEIGGGEHQRIVRRTEPDRAAEVRRVAAWPVERRCRQTQNWASGILRPTASGAPGVRKITIAPAL